MHLFEGECLVTEKWRKRPNPVHHSAHLFTTMVQYLKLKKLTFTKTETSMIESLKLFSEVCILIDVFKLPKYINIHNVKCIVKSFSLLKIPINFTKIPYPQKQINTHTPSITSYKIPDT